MDTDSDKYVNVEGGSHKTLQILNVAAFVFCMVAGGSA
jgi:hypothetical protein